MNENATTEMTAEEVKRHVLGIVAQTMTESPQKNVVNVAKSTIDEQITDKMKSKHRGIVSRIYGALYEDYNLPEFKKLARKNDPYTITSLDAFNSYVKNYDEENNYTCRVFPKSDYDPLVFAPATIAFIGARTSRGKTTTLVSTAVDALEQNKRVFFTTMEESQYQIAVRFISHFLYSDGFYAGMENSSKLSDLEIWQNALFSTKFNPKRMILNVLRGKEIDDFFHDSNLTKQFIKNIHVAKDKLNDLLTSGQLTIYNGLESPSFEYMLDAMTDNDAGDIVLLDYMQKVKTPKRFEFSENRFPILQYATQELANATKKSNIILISGAQFGRTGNKDDNTKMDLFTDESFQECSAIEQAGEIEIGIGRHWNKGVKHSFYSILKDRDNGEYNPSKYYELEDRCKFSKFTPLRRNAEDATTGKKQNKLVVYYDSDSDWFDGETKNERYARLYPKSQRNNNQGDTQTTDIQGSAYGPSSRLSLH